MVATSGASREGCRGRLGLRCSTSAITYAVASAAAAIELLSIRRYRISPEYTAAMPIDVEARVLANRPLSNDYNVLALAAHAIAAIAVPGQFVMLKPGAGAVP